MMFTVLLWETDDTMPGKICVQFFVAAKDGMTKIEGAVDEDDN